MKQKLSQPPLFNHLEFCLHLRYTFLQGQIAGTIRPKGGPHGVIPTKGGKIGVCRQRAYRAVLLIMAFLQRKSMYFDRRKPFKIRLSVHQGRLRCVNVLCKGACTKQILHKLLRAVLLVGSGAYSQTVRIRLPIFTCCRHGQDFQCNAVF